MTDDRKNRGLDDIGKGPLDKAVADYLSIYDGVNGAENLVIITEALLLEKLEDVEDYLKEADLANLVLSMGDEIRAIWLRNKSEEDRLEFAEQFAISIMLKNGKNKASEDSDLEKLRKIFAQNAVGIVNSLISEKTIAASTNMERKIILPEGWANRPNQLKELIIENYFGKAIEEMVESVKCITVNKKSATELKTALIRMFLKMGEEEINEADIVVDEMLSVVKTFFNKKELRDLFVTLARKEKLNK